MPVTAALSVTLEVPSLAEGIRFYEDAGLQVMLDGQMARLRCINSDTDSIILICRPGQPKRLHHLTLAAKGLPEIQHAVPLAGGTVEEASAGFEAGGLWIRDPHGMLLHLVPPPAEVRHTPAARFEINAPGQLVRIRRSAVQPQHAQVPVRPRRLGHLLVFSPDVPQSVAFFTEALGMGLADRAQDIIAFCCARSNSDHHVVAFAKSAGVGFHHASFEVADPDEVGRGGRALAEKAGRGDWGLGRHTIGSNFFHYIQDPWGSWFEYFSDMDHIDDYSLWTPTNYEMADSLANWGPTVPHDFVHNYEVGDVQA